MNKRQPKRKITRHVFSIQMGRQLTESLDRIAADRGESRATLIREAVREYLSKHEKAEAA